MVISRATPLRALLRSTLLNLQVELIEPFFCIVRLWADIEEKCGV